MVRCWRVARAPAGLCCWDFKAVTGTKWITCKFQQQLIRNQHRLRHKWKGICKPTITDTKSTQCRWSLCRFYVCDHGLSTDRGSVLLITRSAHGNWTPRLHLKYHNKTLISYTNQEATHLTIVILAWPVSVGGCCQYFIDVYHTWGMDSWPAIRCSTSLLSGLAAPTKMAKRLGRQIQTTFTNMKASP